jgi:hypothetical protein
VVLCRSLQSLYLDECDLTCAVGYGSLQDIENGKFQISVIAFRQTMREKSKVAILLSNSLVKIFRKI